MDHLDDDQESVSESLNVYPEACASAMLETARLSVSLEGDENFRVKYCFIFYKKLFYWNTFHWFPEAIIVIMLDIVPWLVTEFRLPIIGIKKFN